METVTADVLVLGAGISGLSCAAALRHAGLRVIVLEARHRIGGRLHTVRLPDGLGRPCWPVDLGGAWVHGIGSSSMRNELYTLACECKLGCRHTDYDDAVVYTADGVRLEERAVADIEHLYASFEEHLQSLLHAPDPRLALLPIQTALDAFVSSRRLSPAQRDHLAFAVSNHIEHYWAGEVRCMGVAALDEEVLPGGDVVLEQGYAGIVDTLCRGLDVRLGHEVTAVHYGVGDGLPHGGGGVVMAARLAAPAGVDPGGGGGCGGGGGLVRFAARAAVVTLPVGVLQGGSVAFEPPLERTDPAKAAAIGRLGAAVYNKVIMVFEPTDVFWDDTSFIYRIPRPEEAGRWSWFLNMHKVMGAPILIAFNLGKAATELEGVRDEEAVAGALAALAGLYGAARVRRPRYAVVTRWGSDPHARMSYTYIPAGVTSAAFDDLARPVPGGLFFAGEACHRRHYGTAHGAFESGRVAAAAVLQQLVQGQQQRQQQRQERRSRQLRPVGRSPWESWESRAMELPRPLGFGPSDLGLGGLGLAQRPMVRSWSFPAVAPVRLEACGVSALTAAAGGVAGAGCGVFGGGVGGVEFGMALALVPTGGVQTPAKEDRGAEAEAASGDGGVSELREVECAAELGDGASEEPAAVRQCGSGEGRVAEEEVGRGEADGEEAPRARL